MEYPELGYCSWVLLIPTTSTGLRPCLKALFAPIAKAALITMEEVSENAQAVATLVGNGAMG